ncbi:MAG TPA: hypothetical protein VGK88_12440 [bacterium]
MRWVSAHAEILQLAQRLRADAIVFRRWAGDLQYFPQTGTQTPLDPELGAAADDLRGALDAVAALAARWDEEITWLRSLDRTMPVDDIQRGHAQAREALRLARAALEIFSRVITNPERTALDAPYGAGAPRRVHPGAQCTWVAERADGLARELSMVTLRKHNLLLALPQSQA